MNMPLLKNIKINQGFFHFINDEVLPLLELNSDTFWRDFECLLADLSPVNRQLLATRTRLQQQIDDWHQTHSGQPTDPQAYQAFLQDIGYLVDEGDDFEIETQHVDAEIATLAGPQLVVPLKNARFALNAANARWGSLYDALYGTDALSHQEADKHDINHRKDRVVEQSKAFLDQVFPLHNGSHQDVTSYVLYYHHLLAFFSDGSKSGLKSPKQLVAFNGRHCQPESLVLKNHGLHVEIQFDASGVNGSRDRAGINDIVIESALSTIMDCEDSVAAVDAQDKLEIYRNWLGLMQGTLTAQFDKQGKAMTRRLQKDREYTDLDGQPYVLPGRSLMLIRNVGHLMETDLIHDTQGDCVPEGIVDAVVTSLIAMLDLQNQTALTNSRTGSIYIVKPKMHGPDEVAFSCQLFSRVEHMLGLAENTIKIGIMDEERRTSLNLKACIRAAKHRVVFINTGFLDRTGDEIHTSMHCGAFLPKEALKKQAWIAAYENRNVDIGLQCGLSGKAQIGKGMWAMPDEMAAMMAQKQAHPLSGANTAWVPSPTAATLHALHYHSIDVFAEQQRIKQRPPTLLQDLLKIAVMSERDSLSQEQIDREIDNNVQGILGYVVRWIDAGIGCSKVPDINHVALMEDRATLRISSQHLANWLLHGVCTQQQVERAMVRMAKVVDEQNTDTEGYLTMSNNIDENRAFRAAHDLIFKGVEQENGYTEPLLHAHRRLAKQAR
ncbi:MULTISPECIES: malate synthase G [unclassified Vibrio]|uniref:Malate synthase G n=1 Tax=Vibrio sp. HB236076 TaxID=3232307 RepID=A0AB39HJA4_9VIBR|nr:malate synthase G [Vibrio sp. HB161653]MDP5252778.1 malate synthase G [Vibrio sp. HB161653]